MGYITKEYKERSLNEAIKEEYDDEYTVFYNVAHSHEAINTYKVIKTKKKYIDILKNEEYDRFDDLLYYNQLDEEDKDDVDLLDVCSPDFIDIDESRNSEYVYIIRSYASYYDRYKNQYDYTEDSTVVYNNLNTVFDELDNTIPHHDVYDDDQFWLERSLYTYSLSEHEFELTEEYEEILDIDLIAKNWNREEKKIIEERKKKLLDDFDDEYCKYKRLEISY